jgi:hypothetical protein
MKFVLVMGANETPICYLPKLYSMKGKIIKNVAQKISHHHSPILKVDSLLFDVLRKPNLLEYIDELKDEKVKTLITSLINKFSIFFVCGRAYKNLLFFGFYKKNNSKTFSDLKRKFFFLMTYKDPIFDKIEKVFIEREVDGKIPVSENLEKSFYEFKKIFFETYIDRFPTEEIGGIKTYFKTLEEDIRKYKEIGEKLKGKSQENDIDDIFKSTSS